MATFRSILSRWIFLGAIFFGSFISMGAAWVPLSPSLQVPLDPMRLGPLRELRPVSGPVEATSSQRDSVLSRLGMLVFTERAIATSV